MRSLILVTVRVSTWLILVSSHHLSDFVSSWLTASIKQIPGIMRMGEVMNSLPRKGTMTSDLIGNGEMTSDLLGNGELTSSLKEE